MLHNFAHSTTTRAVVANDLITAVRIVHQIWIVIKYVISEMDLGTKWYLIDNKSVLVQVMAWHLTWAKDQPGRWRIKA